jgi:DedD protein
MIDSNDIQSATVAAPTDIAGLRRQARQRFIGAGVLVLVAVIGLPFILDSKPRPISPDITIEIPKTAPVQAAPAVASQPAAEIPAAAASAAPAMTEVAPVPAAALTAAQAPIVAPTPVPVAVVPAKSDDGTRAAALLEGQTLTAGYAIQAGSYTDKTKLQEVEAKLDKAGLAHYTQGAISKNGTHHTRVRLGPFATQQEANSAAVRVNKLGIKTIVIKP